MSAPWPAPEGLFAFLRLWAWPFDAEDLDEISREGSGFAYWTREGGYGQGETLVFRFAEDALELAVDARHQRRVTLTSKEVDAFAAPLLEYLEGRSSVDALIQAQPAARALLAIYREAADEADAAARDAAADE